MANQEPIKELWNANWVRLDESKLRNTGGDGDVKRVYGIDGKKWPRLTLSIYDTSFNPHEKGCVSISVSRKRGPGMWWEDHDLPRMLVPDLIEMLHEAMSQPIMEWTFNDGEMGR